MDAFIGDYKDAVKYYDKERGENRIKVYVNDELEGTYYTAIVVGIPASDEVIDDDGFEMRILTFGTFGIDVYLAAQQLFNETINRKIEQCIREIQKQIISKADEPSI